MSNRFYGYVPIKEGNEYTMEAIAEKIKKLDPDADVRINDDNISVISKCYPLYIYERGDSWEIFIWRHWEFVFETEETDIKTRKLLQSVCKILGSRTCLYTGEMMFDLLDEYYCENGEPDTIDWKDISVSYREVLKLGWGCFVKGIVFVYDNFSVWPKPKQEAE